MSERGPAARLMATLVRLLPAHLRAGYGEAIVESFEDAIRDRRHARGRLAALVFAMRSVVDLSFTVVREQRLSRARRFGMLRGILWDVSKAGRALRQAPGFTASAVLVLALGIGVNVSIFTAVKALLFTAPPYPDAARLVLVDMLERNSTSTLPALALQANGGVARTPGAGRSFPWSYAKFKLFQESGDDGMSAIAGFAQRSVTVLYGTQSARVNAELVSADYFALLGVQAAPGRLFTKAEDDASSPAFVAVLSHRLWASRFGSDPSLPGRTLQIGSQTVQVLGVAPPGFDGLTGNIDLWLPLGSAGVLFSPFMTQQPQAHWFRAIGRLRPGITVADATARTDAVVQHIHEVYPPPAPDIEYGGRVSVLREARINPAARSAVLVLGGAALLVLLIACANLAGLLLARGLARRREIALRAALGARRGRLLSGLLLESLLLSAAGGIAGIVVAHFGIGLLRLAWPARFAASSGGSLRSLDVAALGLDPLVLAFCAALVLLTGVLCGILPALQLSAAGPAEALRAGGRVRTAQTSRRIEGRAVLIALEVALALVLLVGAGLMSASLLGLLHVEQGYDAHSLLTFNYSVPRNSVAARDPVPLQDALLQRLRADPRVISAASGCLPPLSGHCSITGVNRVEGRPPWPDGSGPRIGVQSISDDYFTTLRVPVASGRTFNTGDTEASPLVAIINRAAARRLFGSDNPLGRQLHMGYNVRGQDDSYTIVGVVGDVLYARPEQGVMPEAYVSMHQGSLDDVVFLRTSVEPLALVPAITAALHAIDPGALPYSIATAAQIAAGATADTRVLLWLLALFAAFAVLLAACGIWSVVAYTVNQRTQELGLRMALGARARSVVALVLRRGALAGALGVALGLPAALASSRLLESLLFGVRPADPRVYFACAIVLGGVALLASWIPARRVTRLDPLRAMRSE